MTNRFFIDLGDKISTLYCTGRYIVSYEEFDYAVDPNSSSDKVLDQLFAVLHGLEIDEVLVVLHGILVQGDYQGLKLSGATAINSLSDYQSLKHLLDTAGVKKCSFFEYSGFYLFNNTKKTMFMGANFDVPYAVIADKDNILSVDTITYSNLKQSLVALRNRYEVNNYIAIDSLVQPALLQYFRNIEAIDDAINEESLKHGLSLFAFVMTTNSEKYHLDESCFMSDRIVSPMQANIADSNVTTKSNQMDNVGVLASTELGNSDDFTANRDSGKTSKKVKHGKKHTAKVPQIDNDEIQPSKKFLSLKVILLLILVVGLITAVTYFGSSFANKSLEKVQQSTTSINSTYANNYAQLEAYKRLDKKTADVNTGDNVSKLSKLSFIKSANLLSVKMSESTLEVVTTHTKKKDADNIKNQIGKVFPNTKCEIVKDGKHYTCKATAQL